MTTTSKILAKFGGYPAFTYRDVTTYIKVAPSKSGNTARTLAYLKKKGEIFTLRKGVYTTRKDAIVSGFGFPPFYYGLLYALTIRELWTQNSIPEVITLKKVRSSRVSIFSAPSVTVSLHHARPKHFFGFDTVNYGGTNVPVSDPEKTLIDLFYYKIRLPIQSYGLLLKKINRQKVKKYLDSYDNHTKKAVNNFLLENKRRARDLLSKY